MYVRKTLSPYSASTHIIAPTAVVAATTIAIATVATVVATEVNFTSSEK